MSGSADEINVLLLQERDQTPHLPSRNLPLIVSLYFAIAIPLLVLHDGGNHISYLLIHYMILVNFELMLELRITKNFISLLYIIIRPKT